MKKKKIIKRLLPFIIALVIVPIALCIYFQSKMDNGTVEAVKINSHVWLLNENNQATCYLVVGEEKAALIDTLNGYQDLSETVSSITKLPVIVINTHGHSDHIGGNGYFGEAYLNKADWEIAQRNCSNILYGYMKIKNKMKDVRYTDIAEGESFDLGGITLVAYGLPGHTPGGMCFLDKQDRILFTGDGINRHCWMQLEESLSIVDFVENLKSFGSLSDEYDLICHGHASAPDDAALYNELLAAAEELRDGKTSMDTTYKYWGGTCMQHPFPSGDGVIVYR